MSEQKLESQKKERRASLGREPNPLDPLGANPKGLL